MIQISNINKTFNKATSVKVLNNISLRFDRGNIYGLNGNNGSGKTTLLKIIAGLLLQDEGDILLDSDLDAKEIKYVNNNPRSFNNRLSAKENLQYFYAISSGKSLDSTFFSSQLISDLGIKNKINEKVSGFSDGELRKLSFLRSFAQNPKFYLIDEAFSSIDPKSCEIILRHLRSLINDNKCYGAVIVSHDLNFLNDSSNKVFKLRNGTIE